VEVPTILVEGPILPADERQTPIHRFPVFNRRNTPIPKSSSTTPLVSSSEKPRRMKNLEDLYDATQVIEDRTLFCFFTNNDPLSSMKLSHKRNGYTQWIKKYMPLKRMIPRS